MAAQTDEHRALFPRQAERLTFCTTQKGTQKGPEGAKSEFCKKWRESLRFCKMAGKSEILQNTRLNYTEKAQDVFVLQDKHTTHTTSFASPHPTYPREFSM